MHATMFLRGSLLPRGIACQKSCGPLWVYMYRSSVHRLVAQKKFPSRFHFSGDSCCAHFVSISNLLLFFPSAIHLHVHPCTHVCLWLSVELPHGSKAFNKTKNSVWQTSWEARKAFQRKVSAQQDIRNRMMKERKCPSTRKDFLWLQIEFWARKQAGLVREIQLIQMTTRVDPPYIRVSTHAR